MELCDSILDPAPEWLGRADVVAGNPPWIAWDHLPQDYRERSKPPWRRYGLFSLPPPTATCATAASWASSSPRPCFRAGAPATVSGACVSAATATRKGLDESRMRESFPLSYAYLQRFEPVLRQRRSSGLRPPFYSMFAVGPYTLAPVKVVWRRMDRRISAAVVEDLVIPQETCVFIEAATADEAHYLCATLNSDRVDALVRAHSVRGGKGFGTPGMLEFLAIRKYDPANAEHRELAALSREAHQLAAGEAAARLLG